jgi:hypothetical protein
VLTQTPTCLQPQQTKHTTGNSQLSAGGTEAAAALLWYLKEAASRQNTASHAATALRVACCGYQQAALGHKAKAYVMQMLGSC